MPDWFSKIFFILVRKKFLDAELMKKYTECKKCLSMNFFFISRIISSSEKPAVNFLFWNFRKSIPT